MHTVQAEESQIKFASSDVLDIRKHWSHSSPERIHRPSLAFKADVVWKPSFGLSHRWLD